MSKLQKQCTDDKIKKSGTTMSPITNLAQGFSCLTATNSLTPCRKISYSDPSPTVNLASQVFSGDSPFSNDSPTFQEGVLKCIQEDSKSGRFRRPFRKIINVIEDNKENSYQCNANEDLIKLKQFSYSIDNDDDSLEDFPRTSQESGFIDRSFASRSNSIPSVRSSVFTDEELDDDDSLFAIDKLVEDEASCGILSSSMSQLISSPLLNTYDNLKLNSVECGEIKQSKTLRKSLSMVFHSGERTYTSKNCRFSNKIDEENETKFSNKYPFKRPEPVDHGITPLQSKRRKSSPVVTLPLGSRLINQNKTSPLVRCYSETAATIMKAVQRSVQNPDLIGDCSKPFALPLIDGRHQDLKAINGETLVELIKGEFKDSIHDFVVVDCRYPYEYIGGHITGAKNVYTKDDIYSNFLLDAKSSCVNQRSIMIFHCEFSSERAPKLLRFLRNKDRELNEDCYPRLHYPEIYILEGGYKTFYQNYKEFCEPQDYKPMLHEDHSEELKVFQKEGKSKTWGKLREIQNRGLKSLKFDNH